MIGQAFRDHRWRLLRSGLPLVQKLLFSGKGLNVRDVLTAFDAPQILPSRAPESIIFDEDFLFFPTLPKRQVDPESGPVPRARLHLAQDRFDLAQALRGMAIANVSPDHGLRPLEDAGCVFVPGQHVVALIDDRELDRDRLEHSFEHVLRNLTNHGLSPFLSTEQSSRTPARTATDCGA